MKLGKVLEIIGCILIGIGMLARIVIKLSDGEIPDMLSEFQFLKFLGFVFLISGVVIMEVRKRRTNSKNKNALTKPTIEQ
ncbi:hypothetical protein [Maribacter sp.]|uniref:hypothetical protein n=1 Tax=Maribacter sp. TaxID=1897614 RepID=UPI0025C4A72B|nr:hypothetical protein [Maribacter sp.]